MDDSWLSGHEYLEISPEQFEHQVLRWLQNCDPSINDFSVVHSNLIRGDSGEYEIDVQVEFSIFGGANITILVECKRYRNPVKREVVMIMNDRLRDIGAHKGMIFSTAGFQSGAIHYASKRGIALIDVADGASNYRVRSFDAGKVEPPPWIDFPDFIGWFQKSDDESTISNSLLSDNRFDPLVEWLSLNK